MQAIIFDMDGVLLGLNSAGAQKRGPGRWSRTAKKTGSLTSHIRVNPPPAEQGWSDPN